MDPPIELVRTEDGLLISRRRLLHRGGMVGLAAAAAPVLAACGGSGGTGNVSGDFGMPRSFPRERWDPSRPAGAKPDLPRRFAFANTVAGSEFTAEIEKHMKVAANEGNLEYVTANANQDAAKNIEQIRAFFTRGVAGLIVTPLDVPAQLRIDKSGMDKGIAIFQINAGPATCIISSIQYEQGYSQASYIARYVKDRLGDEAKICYFNSGDRDPSAIARHTGFKDALREAGVIDLLVADVATNPTTEKVGFSVMNSVLQKHPDVNLVAGVDATVIGALAALKAAGKASNPDLLLVGMDGSAEGLATVKAGNSPFRVTTSVSIPMVGYAPAKFTADWVDGKSIPEFLVFNNVILDTPDAAAKYSADSQNPAKVFEAMANGDDTYCQPLGNINYETHNAYYNGSVPDKLPMAA